MMYMYKSCLSKLYTFVSLSFDI